MALVLACGAAVPMAAPADSVSYCDDLQEYILATQSPMYIEVSGSLHKTTMLFENLPRLTFLLGLVKSGNAPPNLLEALRLVFPQTVIVEKEGILSITDKELTRATMAPVLNQLVVIPQFDGDLESLCVELKRMGHTLRYSPELVNVDDKMSGGAASRREHAPVTLRNFSGSLRELLRLVVRQQSPTASYIVRVMGRDTLGLDVFGIAMPAAAPRK